MVAINPGNPTGSILSPGDMKKMIDIAEDEGMVLLADEVYQSNVYGGRKWLSFKKVAVESHSKVQIVSINSISKGFLGECGHRGGYLELLNIDPKVVAYIHKMFSIEVAPNSPGQLILDCAMKPPTGPICGKQWVEETQGEIASLERRANLMYGALKKLPGVTTQHAAGAMYLLPRLFLPPKFIKSLSPGVNPDVAWTVKFLEEEGVVVSPGSGFGQREGQHHFRITFLANEQTMAEVVERLSRFQTKFMNDYS
jgi:alanine transaminase